MGYQGIMGHGVDFPLSRLGKAIILWVIRVYGLPEVWVKRVSTVAVLSCRLSAERCETLSLERGSDPLTQLFIGTQSSSTVMYCGDSAGMG